MHELVRATLKHRTRRFHDAASHGASLATTSQGTFCTVQPFWEVIGYIDRRLPELLQKHGLRLCLFKQGVTPHPADPHAIDGTRLEVQVSEMLSEELQRPGKKPGPNTLGAAVAALLTFAVGGNSAHAAHLNGIEICFSPESLVAVACFSHALCSSTENALMDVREEVAEVLMIQGVSDKFMKQRAPDHADHAATLPPPAQSTGPYPTGLLHAEPLLSELQVPPLVETRSPPPPARARGLGLEAKSAALLRRGSSGARQRDGLSVLTQRTSHLTGGATPPPAPCSPRRRPSTHATRPAPRMHMPPHCTSLDGLLVHAR